MHKNQYKQLLYLHCITKNEFYEFLTELTTSIIIIMMITITITIIIIKEIVHKV